MIFGFELVFLIKMQDILIFCYYFQYVIVSLFVFWKFKIGKIEFVTFLFFHNCRNKSIDRSIIRISNFVIKRLKKKTNEMIIHNKNFQIFTVNI